VVLIGYMRVSKADGSQVLDLQREALLAAGAEPDRLYQDHASGKRDDRPLLDACLKSLRMGGTLVAWKFDRIGRDLRQLVNLVLDLTTRGVGPRVVAGEGAAIDTTTAISKFAEAAVASNVRELIGMAENLRSCGCAPTSLRTAQRSHIDVPSETLV